MRELVLLMDGAGCATDGKNGVFGPDCLVVHWDGWDVPAGHVPLTAKLEADLVRIRGEHAAWACDCGLLPLPDGGTLQDALRCGESLSAWWCSLLYERHPKMTPNLYTIYKLRALELLADEHQCGSLRVLGAPPALARTLAAFCRASKRAFAVEGEGQAARPSGLAARIYGVMPAPVRALARFAHWWLTIRRALPWAGQDALPKLPRQAPTATIATYFPNIDTKAAEAGRFRSRYWESLHDALNAAAGAGHFVRWLFIRFPAPNLSLRQCLALRGTFARHRRDGASFHYLEEFLRPSDIWAAVRRHVRLSLASLRLEPVFRAHAVFAGSAMNFWEYVRQDWAESFRGWRGLERCLQYRALASYVRMAGPQRWTLFPLENCPWERMLTHLTHEAGHGPVLGAQHSSLRPADFRYFDDPRTFSDSCCASFQPDAIRGNGQSAYGQWLAAGVPAQRLGMVEALRYLYLGGQASAAAPTPETGPKRRLLLLTSFFADEMDAHLALFASAMKAGLLDGWEVAVKPHPYLPVAKRLNDLLGDRAGSIRELGGGIAEHLVPGVVVWASNSTTAALEAAIRGLAVMVMLPVGDFDLCPIQDVPGLARTGTLDDVRRALRSCAPVSLPEGYLALDSSLARWKQWLGL